MRFYVVDFLENDIKCKLTLYAIEENMIKKNGFKILKCFLIIMAIFGSVSFVQVSIYAETVDVEIRSSKVIRVSDDYNYPPFSLFR